jgi:hypothetical protein
MSHKLEKYLAEQRNNLDVESPDDDSVWKGIVKKLREKKAVRDRSTLRLRFIRIRNIAAAVIIIFSLGYITSYIINKKVADNKVSLSSVNSELGKRESEYKATVSFKTDEVKSFINTDDPVVKELFGELKNLDIIYNQSMKDLKELGPNDKVINTIFDTYEQRIRLLELIILEINKTGSHEKDENHEETII